MLATRRGAASFVFHLEAGRILPFWRRRRSRDLREAQLRGALELCLLGDRLLQARAGLAKSSESVLRQRRQKDLGVAKVGLHRRPRSPSPVRAGRPRQRPTRSLPLALRGAAGSPARCGVVPLGRPGGAATLPAHQSPHQWRSHVTTSTSGNDHTKRSTESSTSATWRGLEDTAANAKLGPLARGLACPPLLPRRLKR